MKYILTCTLCFYILVLSYSTHLYVKRINLLFVLPIKGNHGPATLVKSYINTIKIISKYNYILKYFNIIIKSDLSFKCIEEYLNNSNNMIWFIFSNYFKDSIK